MKKILLISDTHNYLDKGLIKHIEAADEIWHAGDIGTIEICDAIEKLKPLKAVFGNVDGNDIRVAYSENLFFDCENVKVFITHIGGYPGKYPTKIKQLILQHKPKLFICGHSHILKVMYDKELELLHINPGACGVHGFHTVKTIVKFEIEGAEIKNLAIIELGSRTSLTS
ncbi:metallophosphoesterase family protein [Aurantibacillus circumpalustris]|uniref:metallophosphoesterase family protein n=1 Tax=Aurantibacillus circumpalustris TaxID=3036359 RepID=UPI00295BA74C|nr:metallophosphoesterase family protein [Aurantibacillus circumpalustris]